MLEDNYILYPYLANGCLNTDEAIRWAMESPYSYHVHRNMPPQELDFIRENTTDLLRELQEELDFDSPTIHEKIANDCTDDKTMELFKRTVKLHEALINEINLAIAGKASIIEIMQGSNLFTVKSFREWYDNYSADQATEFTPKNLVKQSRKLQSNTKESLEMASAILFDALYKVSKKGHVKNKWDLNDKPNMEQIISDILPKNIDGLSKNSFTRHINDGIKSLRGREIKLKFEL